MMTLIKTLNWLQLHHKKKEMRRRQSIGYRGFVLDHKVHNHEEHEGYDELYCDYFCEHPVYPAMYSARIFA